MSTVASLQGFALTLFTIRLCSHSQLPLTQARAQYTHLVRLHVTLELIHLSLIAHPQLLGNGRDESFVVGDDDDTAVPARDRGYERVETLDIEVVSRLCAVYSR